MVSLPPQLRPLWEALHAERTVRLVVLFGSRARAGGMGADPFSDLDLQITVDRPAAWTRPDWARRCLGDVAIEAWAWQPAFGGVVKVSARLLGQAVDFVWIPTRRMRWARLAVAVGWHGRSAGVRRRLGDLAVVWAPGHQVLKGAEGWRRFCARVVAEVPVPGLSDDEVRNLLELARLEHAALGIKLTRGEVLAAQRWLHVQLGAISHRLWTEHRRRAGLPYAHDARRLEWLAPAEDLARLTINSDLSPDALRAAADQVLAATREWGRRMLDE
jgi:hypothetical protein